MNRRHFMQSILAVGVAPFVVTTSGVLMPVRQRVIDLPYYAIYEPDGIPMLRTAGEMVNGEFKLATASIAYGDTETIIMRDAWTKVTGMDRLFSVYGNSVMVGLR